MDVSNFIEHGYRPATEVKDTLTPEEFQHPNNDTRIHYFKSETSPVSELQRAIQATVLVSETQDYPGGSGVIIHYGGRKYLVTATHVIGDLLAGDYGKPEVKYYYRDNTGQMREGILRRGEQLYDSTTARERDLEATDSAIFTFEGDNDGVEISNIDVGYDATQVASAIGFPGEFHDAWKDTLRPLISVGYTFKDKPKEMTPYMKALMAKHMKETGEREGRDFKIFFTGRIVPGNSGGPLVDSTGKVLGVCSGPRGTLGKEDGIERFSDFRQILREVSQNKLIFK